MTIVAMILLTVTGLLAMLDWRKGLAMCVIIGIAQDPLRKLASNQPIFYVVLVGVIFGVAWLRAYLLNIKLTPAALPGWKRDLQSPFTVFAVLMGFQAINSYVRYQSFLMSGVGLLVWFGPIPAILFGYQFALRSGVAKVRRWMLLYIALASFALAGVYLEFAGFDWPTLGSVGAGLTIYDVGVALKAYSGFFRTSEIAAWHAATIGCFMFIVFVDKRPTLIRVAAFLILLSVLVTVGILTGRRKMLVEIAVFMTIYLFLVAWLQRGRARTAFIVLTLGVIGYFAIVAMMPADPVTRIDAELISPEEAKGLRGYAIRGQSGFSNLPERLDELGVRPVLWSIDHFGWLGAGLGTGTQGAQAVVEQHNIYRGAAEGGLGKITMELGVPGLLIVGWFFVALWKHIRGKLVHLTAISPRYARMAYGFVAFLAANVATFSVATQAYSDLFVLLILGWTLGFVLALPALAEADIRRRQERFERPAPHTFQDLRGPLDAYPPHARS
jgi:hypothetical protein